MSACAGLVAALHLVQSSANGRLGAVPGRHSTFLVTDALGCDSLVVAFRQLAYYANGCLPELLYYFGYRHARVRH